MYFSITQIHKVSVSLCIHTVYFMYRTTHIVCALFTGSIPTGTYTYDISVVNPYVILYFKARYLSWLRNKSTYLSSDNKR